MFKFLGADDDDDDDDDDEAIENCNEICRKQKTK